MPKYRKKPVVIEARQLTRQNAFELVEWIHPTGGYDWTGRVLIPTLEGLMTAEPGDYVIKGVQGEFYPCKPDIFAATYEPVED